jgi:hypothetical protein
MNRKTAAFLDENLFQFGKQLLGLHAFWDLFKAQMKACRGYKFTEKRSRIVKDVWPIEPSSSRAHSFISLQLLFGQSFTTPFWPEPPMQNESERGFGRHLCVAGSRSERAK